MANKKIRLMDGSDNLYPQSVEYVAGDTISFNAYSQFGGMWASSSEVRFLIPLSGVVNANGVTFSGGAYFRTNGQSWTSANISQYDLTAYITKAGVVVRIVFNQNPTGASANTPCMIQPNNLTLTFI